MECTPDLNSRPSPEEMQERSKATELENINEFDSQFDGVGSFPFMKDPHFFSPLNAHEKFSDCFELQGQTSDFSRFLDLEGGQSDNAILHINQ